MFRKVALLVFLFLNLSLGAVYGANFDITVLNSEPYNITRFDVWFEVSNDFALNSYAAGPAIPFSWVEDPNPPEVVDVYGTTILKIGYHSIFSAIPEEYMNTGQLFLFDYEGLILDLFLLELQNDFYEDQSEFAFIELSGNSLDINFVPIPGAVWLLASGLIGVLGIKCKKKIGWLMRLKCCRFYQPNSEIKLQNIQC